MVHTKRFWRGIGYDFKKKTTPRDHCNCSSTVIYTLLQRTDKITISVTPPTLLAVGYCRISFPMMRILSILGLLCLVYPSKVRTEEIHYYITSENVIWDYAPSGRNFATSDKENYKTFLKASKNRIGHKYYKAIYKQYTDATYTTEIKKPEWLGFLGPIISGNVNQTLIIHFKNLADRNFTMHPHGVFYNKNSEGALYLDKTSFNDKADDIVQPQQTHIYRWEINDFDSPAEGDPDCIPWIYHSHIDPVKDMYAGLMGLLITCKKGKYLHPDKNFALLLKVMDENLSWYLEKNIKDFIGEDASVDPEDEDFQESNKMHSINGLMYGHLKGLDACMGDNITWFLLGMGNEVDIHTINFYGQSLEYNHHRVDSINIYPAEFAVATMKVNLPGMWLIKCHVHDHFVAGMTAFLTVKACSSEPDISPNGGKVIRYYIAAELVTWNYSQNGQNMFDGGSLTEANSDSQVFFKKGPHRIGGQYFKAIYQEYTDGNFTVRKTRSKEEEHLGFLGPVIKASVGDLIKVEFYNKADRKYSIHPFGLFYNKFSEGSQYNDHTIKKLTEEYNAMPNTVKTYTWQVTKEMGPLPDDPPCITRMYSSVIDYMKDSYSGLVGPMLICKEKALDENGKQKSVDKEFFLLFSVTDENESWYIEKNIETFASKPKEIDREDEDFKESNLMHGINGYLYGNLPGLNMCAGDNVQWHLMSVGNEVDLHTAFFHGNAFTVHKNHKDTSVILPGMFKTLSMHPVNLGTWSVSCQTNDHYNAGTKALYHVKKCGSSIAHESIPGENRTYFIAANEIEWEYAEGHKDLIRGGSLDDPNNDGNAFVKSSSTLIGSKYIKAVFRAYADDTFTIPLTHPRYLGILGPIIRANVGDTIRVVFFNNASFPFSIQPHGVHYDKMNEGSSYEDNVNSTDRKGSKVLPSEKYTYVWTVPDSAGPGPKDPNCINYAYYSAVNPSKDTNSGLVGPLIICKKNTPMKPTFKEFPLLFTVFDENESNYLDKNIAKYCSSHVDTNDEEFIENNKNHGINGFLYGNLHDLIMNQDDTVYWYLMSVGTEVDIHSVHFHGNTFLYYTDYKHRKDTIDLWPGIYNTVVMVAHNPGTWLLHCHVNDHIIAGMETVYVILPKQRG